MILRTLSTGSIGNCYILKASDGQQLILDVGIGYKQILKGLDFDLTSLQGVCVTHEHKDHARSVGYFLERGVPVFRPYIITEPEVPGVKHYGDFKIQAFPLEHDVPCYGFLVTHPEMGKLVYLTDTAYCKFRFKDVSQMLVECNYDSEMLSEDYAALNHVLHDHMGLQTAKKFIEANKTDSLQNVIACHMSGVNIEEEKMLRELRETCGLEVNVYAANGGVDIKL